MSSDTESDTSERSPMIKSPSSKDTQPASTQVQWTEWQEDADIEGLEEEEDDMFSHSRIDRRTYGGKHGRKDSIDQQQENRSVFQVSMDVALSVLSGTPLLVPAAIQTTGIAIGIPLLFLVAFLSWVAHVVLNVERRYVGGFNIARAVFPSRYGGRICGQTIIDMLILGAASLRTILVFSLSVQLLSQCLATMFPQTPYLSNYRWLMFALTLIYIPAFTLPPPLAFLGSPFWDLLRSFSWPLYLISLVITTIRMRNLSFQPPSTPAAASMWSGINLLVFSLCTQQSTFRLLLPLRQTSSSSIKNNLTISIKPKSLKRYGWETSSFIGLTTASLVLLAFSLSFLHLSDGIYGLNVFSSLPSDAWLTVARLLVLVTLLSSLPGTIKPASSALRRIVLLLLGTCGVEEPSDLGRSQNGGRISMWQILDKVAMAVTLAACGSAAWVWGGDEGKLMDLTQVGALFANVLGLLIPAIFFIVLFHVRKARAIFVTDPSALSIRNDELLLRKEQQLQRRLSGRRISQDLIVFGGLLPFSIAVLGKWLTRTF